MKVRQFDAQPSQPTNITINRQIAPLSEQSLKRLKDEISRTFLDQIYLEKEVEKLKIELARQIDFTCIAAYKAFDTARLNNFDLRDFSEAVLDFAGQGMFDYE